MTVVPDLVLNLPRIQKENRVAYPTEQGSWKKLDQLNDLASGLDVEAEAMPLRRIKSVPHTWGHVIMFETALITPNHPAHKDAKAQWRALLAMLALRGSRREFQLKTQSVRFDGDGGVFTRVVGRVSPRPRLPGGSNWDAAHLLYAHVPKSSGRSEPGEADLVLLGMLSPSTVVVPARDFGGDGRLGQFWAREGLRDPIEGDGNVKLSPDELESCRRFTQNLREILKGVPRGEPDTRARSTIVRLLEEFSQDLTEQGAEHHIAKFKEVRQGYLVDHEQLGRLYEALNSVWLDDGSKRDVTDLEVRKIRLDDGEEIKVVLADPRCAGTLGKSPEHISLFGPHTLAELDGPGSIDDLQSDAAKNGILLLTPNDVLADTLTDLREFKTTAHPPSFDGSLLPIKPVALLLFKDLDDLKENLERLGDRLRARVNLRMRLTARDGSSHEHIVTRRYGQGASGGLSHAYAPMALAAWPDFDLALPPVSRDHDGDQGKGWKWNFLFTSQKVSATESERSAIATTGVSRQLLMRDLSRSVFKSPDAGASHCRERLAKWGSGVGPWEGRSRQHSGVERTENGSPWLEWLQSHVPEGQHPYEKRLQRSDWAFEAVLFRLPLADGAAYAGLGVLPPAARMQPKDVAAGGTAELSIDFGTSNTIVYHRKGKGERAPLPFEPHLRRFNEQRREDGRSVDIEAEYSVFMPSQRVEQPFSTVMQVRGAVGVNIPEECRGAGDEPALWRDCAFFDPDVMSVTENLLGEGGGANLIFDLKWGTLPEDRARMGRYLRHINILSLAEVVRKCGVTPDAVTWHFSYPMGLSDEDAYMERIKRSLPGEFDEDIKRSLPGEFDEDIKRSLPSEFDEDKDEGKLVFHTESHAALDYFRMASEAKAQAVLVLDIGGGSTDIALQTREDGPVWQHSVRLAGDDLMTVFLLHNRSFLGSDGLNLDRFGRGGVFGDRKSRQAFLGRPSDQPPTDADRNAARAIINSPLFASAFAKRWDLIMETAAMKRLRAGASVMMGGLSYFLGKQLQSLLHYDRAVLTEEDLSTIQLCFGGRGSTLFSRWENDREFKRLGVQMASHAAIDHNDETVTQYFSPHQKHEAAKGMLADAGTLTKKFRFPEAERVVGIGATVTGGGFADSARVCKSTEYMDEIRGTARDPVVPVVAWDEFREFMNNVSGQCGFDVEISRLAQDAIATDGREAFVNLLRERGEMEPPFIVMLRTTLRLLYEGTHVKVNWRPRQRGG